MTSAPEPADLTAVLAADSATVIEATKRLGALYREWESIPPVANSYRAWADCHHPVSTDPEAFIRHTCLSLLCRMVAYRFLEPLPKEQDLWDTVSGDYFVAAGLGNFLGEDFFSWPYFRRSMGIGDDREPLEIARLLMNALGSHDWDNPPPDLLSVLYGFPQRQDESPVQSGTIQELEENPRLACVALRCGDGAGLASCVKVSVAGRLERGEHPLDTLLAMPEQFLAMTHDPLAATVASTAFVFALGDIVKGPHPPILVPVYLADSSRVPMECLEPSGERSFVINVGGEITLPERVATDPLYLDWLLGRLPNYLRGAALRLRAQAEGEAVQEVLNAWYNYLTSPKARTPIPDPLTPAAADVMVEAARSLILAYVHGSGPAPLHIARNAPAPLFANRREFDLTI